MSRSFVRFSQGPLLLKQANEIEAYALQAREQVSHLQNVLRGQVAAQEQRRREEAERKAREEAMRLEEAMLREERIREAAQSGNAFGALAGLKGQGFGDEIGSKRGGDEKRISRNGKEKSQKEKVVGGGAFGALSGFEEDRNRPSSAKETRAKSGSKAGVSGNPFGSLREQVEAKQRGESLSVGAQGDESLDEEELKMFIESWNRKESGSDSLPVKNGSKSGSRGSVGSSGETSLGQVASPAASEGVRTGRGVKKLGARMKKRPNQVLPAVPDVVSKKLAESSLEASAPEKVEEEAVNNAQPLGSGVEVGENGKGSTASSESSSGQGRPMEDARDVQEPSGNCKESPSKKKKGLAGWKGQLAQLKDLQRR
jgi:hypothetical protein